MVGDGGLKAYLAALPRVFGYPARGRNLAVLLSAWLVIAVGVVGAGYLFSGGRTCFGLVVFVVTEGTFAALCFNTVHQSAEGERDLPGLPLSLSIDEWWPAAIVPFFGFLLTCVIALGPVIAYGIYGAMSAPPGQALPPTDLAAMVGLLGLGLFLWPMLVLVLTVGDFKALVRIDAMVVTAIQTFPAYVCTLLLVYGCAAILVFIGANLPKGDVSGVVTATLILGVRVYTQIAAMMAIGTYYHCYQSKFEWL